jgi:hypothetical protein
MVSSLAIVQANLQHRIALIQKPWYRENCIRGLNIPGYTFIRPGGGQVQVVRLGEMCVQLDAARTLWHRPGGGHDQVP